MIQEAYFTIVTYSVLAVFLLLAIIYRYRKSLKYWWLRNFTKTQICTEFEFSIAPPIVGQRYWMGGMGFPSGNYIYLGKNKFKRV